MKRHKCEQCGQAVHQIDKVTLAISKTIAKHFCSTACYIKWRLFNTDKPYIESSPGYHH